MSELYSTVETLRSEYREIFLKSFAEINKRVENLRPQGLEGDLFDDFSKNPAGQKWCADVLTLLEKDISKDAVILIAVREESQNDLADMLKQKGYYNLIAVDGYIISIMKECL